jgi:hypothetical protein
MRTIYTSGGSNIQSGQAISIVGGAFDALDNVVTGETEYTFASVPERVVRQSAQFENLSMAVQYIDRTNNSLNGAELLNFIFGFIPRAVWPSKPLGSLGGWFYSEVYGYGESRTAAAITVPGDFYLNFNWWGLILGLFIYGAILRIVYEAVILGKPTIRAASLLPFLIVGLGIPSSEIGSYLNGLLRQIILYCFVISFFLLPKVRILKNVSDTQSLNIVDNQKEQISI